MCVYGWRVSTHTFSDTTSCCRPIISFANTLQWNQSSFASSIRQDSMLGTDPSNDLLLHYTWLLRLAERKSIKQNICMSTHHSSLMLPLIQMSQQKKWASLINRLHYSNGRNEHSLRNTLLFFLCKYFLYCFEQSFEVNRRNCTHLLCVTDVCYSHTNSQWANSWSCGMFLGIESLFASLWAMFCVHSF